MRSARRARGKVLGVFSSFRQAAAVLALVGLGTVIVVPDLRSWATDTASNGIATIRRVIKPQFTPVKADPATGLTPDNPGHEAKLANDGDTNSYWLATADDQRPTIKFTFPEPVNIDLVLITPGAPDQEFEATPRPRDLSLLFKDAEGNEVETKQATLEDIREFQKVDVSASDVTVVEIIENSCWGSTETEKACAISEVEFQKQK